jgi:6-pyruvoyltetrahydropterin/6-carboxytetrahydropterin synthase
MFEISVDEMFSAGHALRGYKGKCENPHGHNYKVRVILEGPDLNSIGLLFDFVHLKQIMRAIIEGLDHKFLNDQPPFDKINPSAENLAKYFYEETSRGMKAISAPSALVASVGKTASAGASGLTGKSGPTGISASPGISDNSTDSNKTPRIASVTVWETDFSFAVFRP